MALKLLQSVKCLIGFQRICCYHSNSKNSRWRSNQRKNNFDNYNNNNAHRPRQSLIVERNENDNDHDKFELEEFQDAREASEVIMRSDELYDEHRSERDRRRWVASDKIIGKKYFRPPMEVDLLSYAAKQQIRHLHESDPEEWTLKRLAESFPVSIAGVKRILKSKRTLKHDKDVQRHDKKIGANWKAMGIDGGPILTPNGKRPSVSPNEQPTELAPNQSSALVKRSEFLNIIVGYEKAVSGGEKGVISGTVDRKKDVSVVLRTSNKPMTAQEFSQRALAQAENRQILDDDEKEDVADHLSRKVATEFSETAARVQSFEKFDRRSRSAKLDHTLDVIEENYWKEACTSVSDNPPLKIDVKHRKKSGVHRYKDSYYDEDGDFLYRVPGMSDQ